jgi:hypothetical protein
MINTQPLTTSERSARALLAAWNSGELARLEEALDGTAGLRAVQAHASESERIELVREIAGSIRVWIEGIRQKSPTDLNASLKLLRHLARCEKIRVENAARAVPQSETHVYAQN